MAPEATRWGYRQATTPYCPRASCSVPRLTCRFQATLAGGQQIATDSLGLVNYEEWVLMSGTVRGRIGYAFDNWLPYLTGGFAWSVNQALILPPDTLASAVEDIFPVEN